MTDEQKARLRKFIEALRSGKYIQIFRQLYAAADIPGKPCYRCTEGVMCDVYQELKGEIIPNIRFAGAAPEKVRNYFGLPEFSYISEYGQHHTLIGANDGLRVPFSGIADNLEKQFLTETSAPEGGPTA